ncbi:hypothetical protein LPB072_01620 [Hydrogenophaga crassostreae]|uniref:Uncharacterized protein n=1 Tax=Hydrogenophaga crassostreae TaxID=1763535 RepID=A0A1D8NRN0_9BURK|nr:hypothetical protein LPB072_01620 [Hydrogenophaga crassostreae]
MFKGNCFYVNASSGVDHSSTNFFPVAAAKFEERKDFYISTGKALEKWRSSILATNEAFIFSLKKSGCL